MNIPPHKRPILEERVNTLTHGIGAALSIVALILLVTSCPDCNALRLAVFSIYGASLVLLYLASTVYHGFWNHPRSGFLKRLDHSAIYLLIAGTYTPFTLLVLKGAWGWSLFGVIWGLALVGIVYKLFFYHEKHKVISAILYLLMGWLAIIAIKPLFENLPGEGLLWLGLGGLSYSLGVIFYLWKNLPFSHGIWHLFVLGGSICHFLSIYFYV